MIVATAGHIDHGKTVLVKALSGVDTDRLPEEKRRGMTIEPGFAYRPLADGKVLGFVDVPGHERFVRNMLAGVAGIDFALLVVAADDGPMPQTAEHLAILDLLGVSAGAVALTKIDRVPADRVAEMESQTRGLLAETALHAAPVFPVSGATGAGIEALGAHLEAAARSLGQRQSGGNFRLAVDRCFTLAGVGLVVTGSVFSGIVREGDRLVLSPAGVEVRVRGIHAQNRRSRDGRAGERCAINLAGEKLHTEAVHRGDWLVETRAHAPTARFDSRVYVLAGEERALRHQASVHVHLGAADATGRLAVLDGRSIAPGTQGLVQLVLDAEIGALKGDRFILRDRSGRRTIAGGTVIDPFAPARGRATEVRRAVLAVLSDDDPAAALARLMDASPGGVELGRFAVARNLNETEAQALSARIAMVSLQCPAGPIAFSPARWKELQEAVVARLGRWHDDAPETLGPGEDALNKSLSARIPPETFAALIRALAREGVVARSGACVHLPAHRPRFGPADAALWARAGALIEAGGLRPPRLRELTDALAIELRPLEAFLGRAQSLGYVVRVAKNRYFPPHTLAELAGLAETLAGDADDGIFTAASFRDASGIGRNLSIEVLEFFDRVGFTHRRGDSRRILVDATEAFPSTEP
jgi:selenocysteine-specific elongation factor